MQCNAIVASAWQQQKLTSLCANDFLTSHKIYKLIPISTFMMIVFFQFSFIDTFDVKVNLKFCFISQLQQPYASLVLLVECHWWCKIYSSIPEKAKTQATYQLIEWNSSQGVCGCVGCRWIKANWNNFQHQSISDELLWMSRVGERERMENTGSHINRFHFAHFYIYVSAYFCMFMRKKE